MKSRLIGLSLFFLLFTNLYNFDTKLSIIQAFPNPNSQKIGDYIATPYDVELFNNSFFATDAQESCIKVFSDHGEIIRIIGRRGQGPGELQNPYVITIDKMRGVVYCWDSNNSQIVSFTADGKYLNSFRTSLSIWDMIFLDDYLYLAGYSASNKKLFIKMDMNGNIVNFFGEFFDKKINDMPIRYQEQLYGILELAGDSENIYAIYERIPFIQVFDKQGKLKKTIKINLKEAKEVYKKNLSAPKKKHTGGRMGISKWMFGACVFEKCFYCYAPYQVGAIMVLNSEGNLINKISFREKMPSNLLAKKRFIKKYGTTYLFIDFEDNQIQLFSDK